MIGPARFRSASLAVLLGAVLATGLAPTPATAVVTPAERLADPALEARARALSKELRCLVCQNQSIDDSDAELAGDLRRLVRERLSAGDTDTAILDYVVARYGTFVLLAPPLTVGTGLLWAGPFALLALGAAALAWAALRRRRAPGAEPTPLSGSERAELDRLLQGGRQP